MTEPNADELANRRTNRNWPATRRGLVDESSIGPGSAGAVAADRRDVDEPSTRTWNAAALGPVLFLDPPSWVPAVPEWAIWTVGVLLVLASVVWAVRERSARGTARRGRETSSRVVGGLGLVGVGVVGGLVGALEGAAMALGSLGDVVFAHPSVLVDLGIGGIAYAALDGAVALGADSFALIAGVVILLGIMARN